MKTKFPESEGNTLEPSIDSFPDEQSKETAEIMSRFNEVFLRHDPTELKNLIAEQCVIEKIGPAPDGDRCVGREACIALWEGIATEPGTHFDLEEVFAAGDRAIIRWRYWLGWPCPPYGRLPPQWPRCVSRRYGPPRARCCATR